MSLTVKELADALNEFLESGGDAVANLPIYASYDYGDIAHTQALAEVGYPCEGGARDSAYSMTGLAVCDPDDEDDIKELVVTI